MNNANKPASLHTEDRELSIEELLQIVLRRKLGIAVIVLCSLVVSLMVYFSRTPEYRAESVLMINQESSTEDLVDAVLGGGPAADSKMARKDVELLQSLPISEMTVKMLWDSSQRDSLGFFGHRSYISPLRRVFKWVLPVQQAKAEEQPMSQDSPYYSTLMRFYALKLNGRIRVEGSRETSVLKVSVASPFPDESVFLTNMLCEVYKKSDIQRNSEKYIQSNRFVAEMLKEQKKSLTDADAALSKFMTDNQMYEVTGNTAQLLSKLVEFDGRYNDIKAEYNIVRNNHDFLEKKLSEADRELSNRIAQNVNAQLGSIQDEMRARESEYISMLREKGVNAAEVNAKKQQLDQLKSRYENLSRSKIAGQIEYVGKAQKYRFDLVSEKLQTEQKLNQLKFSAGEYQRVRQYYENQLGRLPVKEQAFVRLERDREVVSKTYLFLKEKLDETRILIGSEVGSVSIIGSAFKPFHPEKPELVKSLLMGLVSGLILAAGYVFGAEMFDDTVNEETLFYKGLGFNLLGVVPFLTPFDASSAKGLGGKLKRRFKDAVAMISNPQSKTLPVAEAEREVTLYPLMTDKLNSSFAESFRTLRTNIGFTRIDQPVKILLVSGCTMGEGKSTVAANHALSWAVADKKTLIIDSDLRRPSQHNIFKNKRIPGLSDYLASNELEIEERYFQPTHHENLFMISSGSAVPNPNELLGSEKMKKLLENLAGRFEKIIIDSPPIFISDAAQLVGVVDGVLITARLQYSSSAPLKQYSSDSYLHSRIIGVALIDRPRSGINRNGFGGKRYGYGRYGYHYYSNEYPENT